MNDQKKTTIESMTPELIAETLKKSGSKTATIAEVKNLIEEGKLASADGSISFIKFTAYMEGKLNGKI